MTGSFVLRHPVSSRTAVMSIVSEKVLLPTDTMYLHYPSIKSTIITADIDDGVCEFLGILEATIRLEIVKCARGCSERKVSYARRDEQRTNEPTERVPVVGSPTLADAWYGTRGAAPGPVPRPLPRP